MLPHAGRQLDVAVWWRSVLLLLSVIVLTQAANARSARAPRKPRPIYATWQTFPAPDGRRLRLLEDSRVTSPSGERHGMVHFAIPDLLPARLELLDPTGRVLDEKTFERPVADAELWSLGPPNRTLAITVDYSCGMGSYCGPITQLYETRGNRLERVSTFDRTLGKSAPIELMRSLKTDWRRERAPEGDGWDILAVVCRPTLSLWQIYRSLESGKEPKVEFVTAYVRHRFRNGEWTTHWTQRKEYTDILGDSDVPRLPSVNGRDSYLSNQGLSLGRKPPRHRRLEKRQLGVSL
jgi:hypothetical protein